MRYASRGHVVLMHPLARHARLLVLLLVAVALLAACGDDDAAPIKDAAKKVPAVDSGGEAQAQAKASLQIRVSNVGSKAGTALPVPALLICDRKLPATCRGDVTCPAADEGSPDADRCRWLAAQNAEQLFAPLDEGQMCTQQYGGAELATVTGTIDGDKVDASYARNNGCEIARFDAASPLWTGVLDGTMSRAHEPDIIDDPPEAFEQ